MVGKCTNHFVLYLIRSNTSIVQKKKYRRQLKRAINTIFSRYWKSMDIDRYRSFCSIFSECISWRRKTYTHIKKKHRMIDCQYLQITKKSFFDTISWNTIRKAFVCFFRRNKKKQMLLRIYTYRLVIM